MEPEFTCPALQEHGTFIGVLTELEEYLMNVLALKKDPKGSPIPDPTKTKIPYDRNKVTELLDALAVPLFSHVSSARSTSASSESNRSRPALQGGRIPGSS